MGVAAAELGGRGGGKDDIAQGLSPDETQQRLAQLRTEAALAGMPDLSNMPKGLDQLPPGLEGIDLSQLKLPKK